MKAVAVLGDGAWGTAVATVLAHNGYTVNLWCYNASVAQTISAERTNTRYLPGIQLSQSIIPFTNLSHAVGDATYVFEAIPVKYMRSVLVQLYPYITQEHIWVVLSKGIEVDTLLLPTDIIDQLYGAHSKKAVMVGPSYARELAQKQPTAVTIAAHDICITRSLHNMVSCEYCDVYPTDDLIGVQVAAAVKNVIALAVGLLEGAGYGDNTKAYCITRGLAQMEQFVMKLSGKRETVYGLAGVGDLILTCTGKLSKNQEVGRRLGKGESLEAIIQEIGYIPEGINTVQAIHQLTVQHGIELAICEAVFKVIFNAMPVESILTM